MQKENAKRLFVEVNCDVVLFTGESVLMNSTIQGAYGDLNTWEGLDDIW